MKEFHSIAHFVQHLALVIPETIVAQHEGLEHAAKIVEKEAKREIGEYQDAAGEFVAWAELADSTKDDRLRQGFTENDPLLRTGELRDSIEHRCNLVEAYVGSDNDIAVYQELGTDKMPPRSFLGGAAIRKEDEVAEVLGERMMMALVGKEAFRGRIPFD